MESQKYSTGSLKLWQAQKITQRSRFIMWIVATLPEFQETELESQVAEGNTQVQNIIFPLYSISHLFLQPGPAGRKSSIGKTLSCCAPHGAATVRHSPLCHTGRGLPSAVLLELGPNLDGFWADGNTAGCLMLYHSFLPVKKKRHFIFGETGKLCDSYYTELMLNNFNFENFKSIQYFIDIFLHNTLKMTNSIWWGGINAHFI